MQVQGIEKEDMVVGGDAQGADTGGNGGMEYTGEGGG